MKWSGEKKRIEVGQEILIRIESINVIDQEIYFRFHEPKWALVVLITFCSRLFIMSKFNKEEIDRIIEMAWEDRTPFEAIEFQFCLKENDVRKIMRKNLSYSSFKLWRKRVRGRKTKHKKTSASIRFKSKNQKWNFWKRIYL